MSKPVIAISVGDPNGVGLEIALSSHSKISEVCSPIYCVNSSLLHQALLLLNTPLPKNFKIYETSGEYQIQPGVVQKEAGIFSYNSFYDAISLCEKKKADALVTMPIHKEAWMMAGLEYKGHTDYLRKHFKQNAIMMLGIPTMFVALYTEHTPLKKVPEEIQKERLEEFFLNLYKSIGENKIAVLGLNPHAGDNGVLGDEEQEIELAIAMANKSIGKELFVGPIVPDIAFTPSFRKNFNYFIAMYHDQGLAPLKALYFDESVNISLNLPIIRTSVDHGTAFDIAYKGVAKTLSYENAIKSAINFTNNKYN
jgi:4-hydroxythreonine-4-phosphate dehydrogenase